LAAKCHSRHFAPQKCGGFFANHQDLTLGRNVRLNRRARSLELSVTGAIAAKNYDQGFAPDPRGKEVSFKG
jgi:hypothetical protein